MSDDRDWIDEMGEQVAAVRLAARTMGRGAVIVMSQDEYERRIRDAQDQGARWAVEYENGSPCTPMQEEQVKGRVKAFCEWGRRGKR